ncbi:uncharacterized protein LOC135809707 isoform X2 [Sycon ciliatum]|uniref:uncharacterized protein LOC135809707 isoform X2 n=1 Tax=Sycon ciliatum TaxID=27933 RepID=UPI0031F6462A
MTRLTEVFVLLFVMLAGPSFSLRTDGVVVQAADPRGPDYFRTDLGSTATLQCPGVLGFSMPINSVSWFRGNSTSAAVILDDRTAVSSDGMLVIQTVKKAESGWYFCQYDSPGGPVTGRAHLNVIELEITIHIIDRSTGYINSLPGMQQGMINIKENQIVALDAKSTRGDHLPDRDPYWLFKGENAALRRPYFCYTGFISQNGDSILRMVMLSSVANFSGRYDFIAGGLSTYINVTIRVNVSQPAKLLTQAQEFGLHLNCDDMFKTRIVTLPPPPMTTTASTTTTFLRLSTSQDSTELASSAPPSSSSSSTVLHTAASTRQSDSPMAVVSITLWPAYVAAGAGVLACCIVTAVLCYNRRGSMTVDGTAAKKKAMQDREKQLHTVLPPRPANNNNRSGEYLTVLPKSAQAAFQSAECVKDSPVIGHIHNHTTPPSGYSTYAEFVCPSIDCTAASSVASMSLQHSNVSLDRESIQTPTAFRTGSEATMLSSLPNTEHYDSQSLDGSKSLSVTGGAFSRSQGARSAELLQQSFELRSSARLPAKAQTIQHEAMQNSCPTQRRHDTRDEGKFPSTARLLHPSESPHSAANIVINDPSPQLLRENRPRTASSLSRTSTATAMPYTASPLVNSYLRREPDSESYRSSANIVVSPDTSPNITSPGSSNFDGSDSSEGSDISRTRIMPGKQV